MIYDVKIYDDLNQERETIRGLNLIQKITLVYMLQRVGISHKVIEVKP